MIRAENMCKGLSKRNRLYRYRIGRCNRRKDNNRASCALFGCNVRILISFIGM